jgi:hypothetical protein
MRGMSPDDPVVEVKDRTPQCTDRIEYSALLCFFCGSRIDENLLRADS